MEEKRVAPQALDEGKIENVSGGRIGDRIRDYSAQEYSKAGICKDKRLGPDKFYYNGHQISRKEANEIYRNYLKYGRR